MDIDQRIQALTASVELLSQMHQDNEKRFREWLERHDKSIGQLNKSIEQLTRVSDQLTHIAVRLTDIAENHEDRIRDLEGGNDGR